VDKEDGCDGSNDPSGGAREGDSHRDQAPLRLHEVFSTGKRFVIVDFFLQNSNVVIECWISRSRRGEAMAWMERNAAYLDLKFRRLKEEHSALRCFALAEAPQIDELSLQEVIGVVMVHADSLTYSVPELESILRELP